MVDRYASFAWYELLTTDMAAAETFYGSILGWTAREAASSKFAYSVFSADETPVCGLMELPLEGRRMGATPRWVGYLALDDLDTAVDRLKHLGGAVYVPPTDTNIGRIAVVADPQRATFALVQALKHGLAPAKPGKPGRVGWHELLAGDWRAAASFYRDLFGWQCADAGDGSTDSYQVLSVRGRVIGGVFNKLPIVPLPFWLYYFNVPDIGVATDRVTAGGGRIVLGPNQLPGVDWIAWCIDPQGAMFALQSEANQSGVERFRSAELGWSAAWGGFASRGKLVADTKPAPNPPSSKPPQKR